MIVGDFLDLKQVARLQMAVNAILFLMKKGRALNKLLLDPTGTWLLVLGEGGTWRTTIGARQQQTTS